jgi:hypothetical protein
MSRTTAKAGPTGHDERNRRDGFLRRFALPLAAFVAGGIASPALADLYENVKSHFAASAVTTTKIRALAVVGYDGELLNGYRAIRTEPGVCTVSSLVITNNPNAYRCRTGNEIADPCLAMRGGHYVACVTSPWDKSILELRLEAKVALDPAFVASEGKATPWALEVQDPDNEHISWHCLPVTGAQGVLAGHRPTWDCRQADGSGGAVVLDEVRIGKEKLVEVLFDNGTDSSFETAKVSTAWY